MCKSFSYVIFCSKKCGKNLFVTNQRGVLNRYFNLTKNLENLKMNIKERNNAVLRIIFWILEGIIVGFGAIMPGISGGTLCVAFGMYLPLIYVISHPKQNLKKYWKMLLVFAIGVAIGFVGLSGLASWLLKLSTSLVTCAFIGFILGTFPELWHDAGEQGRKPTSFLSLFLGFALMLALLLFLQSHDMMQVQTNIFGFLLCGILWGLSFIVPGLSSSTLLLFFGLYEPMLEGIAKLDFRVILPLAVGMIACVLLLSKGVNFIYKKFYTQISHFILGVVAATTIMIFPDWSMRGMDLVYALLCIIGGCIVSYFFTRVCASLKEKQS